MNLPEELINDINTRIERYPNKRSAVLMLLHKIQDHEGYISSEAIHWIAKKLEMESVQVYELVTFYPMLRQKPVGRLDLKVCRTLSCALKGSHELCKRLQEKLQCPGLDTPSADGAYSVSYSECLAACHKAPVVQVGQGVPEAVALESVDAFVDDIVHHGTSSVNKKPVHEAY